MKKEQKSLRHILPVLLSVPVLLLCSCSYINPADDTCFSFESLYWTPAATSGTPSETAEEITVPEDTSGPEDETEAPDGEPEDETATASESSAEDTSAPSDESSGHSETAPDTSPADSTSSSEGTASPDSTALPPDSSAPEETAELQTETKVKKIKITAPKTVTVGQSAVFEVTVTPETALNKDVVWSVTTGKNICVLSQDGSIIPYKTGKITVRATAADGSKVYGTCTVTAAYPTWEGKGTKSSPYLISNADELMRISGVCPTSGLYFRQTADIVLDGNFTPIGFGIGSFAHTYDGGGFSITGLNINSPVAVVKAESFESYGLFAEIHRKGAVSNLRISGSINVPSGSSAGLLCGNDLGGKFTDIITEGSVSCSSCAGGISGTASGSYTRAASTAGISVSSGYAGGLFGRFTGTATLCSASGNVTGGMVCGGFAGFCDENIQMSDCVASGNVTTHSPSAVASSLSGPVSASAARAAGSFIAFLSVGDDAVAVPSVKRCVGLGRVVSACDPRFACSLIGFVCDERTKYLSIVTEAETEIITVTETAAPETQTPAASDNPPETGTPETSVPADTSAITAIAEVTRTVQLPSDEVTPGAVFEANYSTGDGDTFVHPREFANGYLYYGCYVSVPYAVCTNIPSDGVINAGSYEGLDFKSVWTLTEKGPELAWLEKILHPKQVNE